MPKKMTAAESGAMRRSDRAAASRLSDKAIASALRNEAARPKWTIGALARLVGHCQNIVEGTCPGAGAEEAAAAADLLSLICRIYRETAEVDP